MYKRTQDSRETWEKRYKAPDYQPNMKPVPFLVEMIQGLPPGQAICLAAGTGRNAIFLAQNGYQVTAIDISQAALDWCDMMSNELGVEVKTLEADLLAFDFGNEAWDLATNLYFYEPSLFQGLKQAISPGGHILFQTYSKAHKKFKRGPSNDAFLVHPHELENEFRDWELLYFEETEYTYEQNKSESVIQMLARKPKD